MTICITCWEKRKSLTVHLESKDKNISYFIGAFEDLVNADVAQVLLDGIVFQIAVPTVKLQRRIHNL